MSSTLTFEVHLEVQHSKPLTDEDRADLLVLMRKRLKFDGYSRYMNELAVRPVTVEPRDG